MSDEGEAKARDEQIERLRSQGRPVVLFAGRPFDGMVYAGDVVPPVGHFGAWDQEAEAGRVGLLMGFVVGEAEGPT